MTELRRPLRIAVLGAGPIGIEAAIYGATLGHDVVVIEQGTVGQAMAMWNQVTLFSPWRMNITPLGARLLHEMGRSIKDLDRCPTGAEMVTEYLLPLSHSPLLKGRLRLGHKVVAVGRHGLLKGDLVDRPERAAHHFRLLLEDSSGEQLESADVVLDCTGTYLCPNSIGDGGIPAPGERWLTARLIRHVPDVLGRDRRRFAGRRTLLVGGGLSAATAATELERLCSEEKGTQVIWAMRKPARPPYAPDLDDPLPERARLLDAANRVAMTPPSGSDGLRFCPGVLVDSLAAEGHQLRVRLHSLGQKSTMREELFDEIIGLTGYGPDRSMYGELQLHECYASFGPMKLAASLTNSAGNGCATQAHRSSEILHHPEPGFFILGAKSYAKNSSFLLQIGHAQIRDLYFLLQENRGLDLYLKG